MTTGSSRNGTAADARDRFREMAAEAGVDLGLTKGKQNSSQFAGIAKTSECNGERLIILPDGLVSITQAGEKLFRLIGPTKTLFNRGGAVVELVSPESKLEVVRPERARSLFEKYGQLMVWRSGANGERVLKPSLCPEQTASALLASDAARDHLPTITGLLNCPICVAADDSVEITGTGYHEPTGLLITGGEMPPIISVKEAVQSLKNLFAEFDFHTPSDRSRALATLLTPGLKFGRHLKRNVPIDMAEADQSQSGKTFRQRLVAAVYNEKPTLITEKDGGVGSVDEKFDHALISGRPFIQFDNFRGHMNSRHLEAFLTSEGRFPARVPHSKYINVDPTHFFVQLSSNGIETTRDLANRSCIVRIRKRPEHNYLVYPEGDLLDHIRGNQPYYLGCVFAVIRKWVEDGQPRSRDARHDFREWCQMLDWIIQNIFREAPLLDGHTIAQNRVSDAALTFLRKIALELERSGGLSSELIAGQIYELAVDHGIEIPGLKTAEPKSARLIVGRLMAKVFADSDQVEIEGFLVRRLETLQPREDKGSYTSKSYAFTKRGT